MNEINKYNFSTESSSFEAPVETKKENSLKNEKIACNLEKCQIKSNVPQIPKDFIDEPLMGGMHATQSYPSFEASLNTSSEASSELFEKGKAPLIKLIEVTDAGRAQCLKDFGIEKPHPVQDKTTAAFGHVQPCSPELAKKFKYHAVLASYFPFHCTDNSEFKNIQLKPEHLVMNLNDSIDTKQRLELMANLAKGLRRMGFKHSPNGIFYNEQTGTSLYLVVGRLMGASDHRVFACFGGLRSECLIDSKSSIKKKMLEAKMCKANMHAASEDFLGGTPKASIEAMNIGCLLRECCRATNYRPEVIGHSHGGGLAICAASAADIPATVFNARPIGSGMQNHINAFRKHHSLRDPLPITAFVTKDDWVAHERGVLHGVASLLHKHPAFFMGNVFELPLPGKGVNAHNGYVESIIGLDKQN